MATIVNNPPPDRTLQVEKEGSAGWAVAVVILVAVVVAGAFLWMRYNNAPAGRAYEGNNEPGGGSANINVTLPAFSGAPTSTATSSR